MNTVSFNDIFHPEKNWENKCLTASCPCDTCDVFKEYEMKARYGTTAERQFAELPDSCASCIKKLLWRVNCMQKLRWYEAHDERLKKEGTDDERQ